ncbi:DUF1360 domain-containing protein [Melittangium boletus]|uniref:Integral membrane protein n=1 Tax=Melittangium boletus DSM 14713 TaxID=1294270 RepID=A0A250I6V3_9BACT|nr:DUF1360 domain-containing protein [Melittangium boletus]ATB27594.1 integral membrane protein [Melittangium boletus DSM 14713]
MTKALAETKLFAGYDNREDLPLGSYLLLMGVYGASLAGYFAWRGGGGRRAFPRMDLEDVLLFGLATHKITRITAKDFVTTLVRAPFVRFQRKERAGEVSESSRGGALRRAVGDLLSCPFCLGPWVAGALVSAHAVRPSETRLVASIFALTTLSDFLQRAYEWVGQGLKHTRERAKAVEMSEGPLKEGAPAQAH